MRALFSIILATILFSSSVVAQDTKVYFGFGGLYSSFQDTRFSDVQYNKATVFPEIGFYRISDKSYWHANASAFIFKSYSPNSDTIEIANTGFNISMGYLHKLSSDIFIGGTWDVIDYVSRDNNLLGNNSNFYKTSSDIFVSAKYLLDLDDDWSFNFGLDYGLLSFVNSAPSFTANFPQKIVDSGDVSFQDSDTRDPFSVKLMEAKPFWEHFIMRTIAEVKYRERLSLAYTWNMRSYADNKHYPITDASHALTLRFNFISHQKQK